MKKKLPIGGLAFAIWVVLCGLIPTAMASMANYTALPPFLTQTVKPNVLVILDTSTSMLQFAYEQTASKWSTDLDPIGTYEGYFDSTKDYSYDSTYDYFYEDASGIWSGNLLNFVCMRRIDIAKMVLTGGRTTTAGDGSTLLMCQPYPSGCGWPGGYDQYKKFTLSGSTTYARHYRTVDATGGFFYLCDSSASPYGSKYYTRVKISGTPQGVIQNSGPYYRFGLQIYSPTGNADQGGKVLSPVAEGDALLSQR